MELQNRGKRACNFIGDRTNSINVIKNVIKYSELDHIVDSAGDVTGDYDEQGNYIEKQVSDLDYMVQLIVHKYWTDSDYTYYEVVKHINAKDGTDQYGIIIYSNIEFSEITEQTKIGCTDTLNKVWGRLITTCMTQLYNIVKDIHSGISILINDTDNSEEAIIGLYVPHNIGEEATRKAMYCMHSFCDIKYKILESIIMDIQGIDEVISWSGFENHCQDEFKDGKYIVAGSSNSGIELRLGEYHNKSWKIDRSDGFKPKYIGETSINFLKSLDSEEVYKEFRNNVLNNEAKYREFINNMEHNDAYGCSIPYYTQYQKVSEEERRISIHIGGKEIEIIRMIDPMGVDNMDNSEITNEIQRVIKKIIGKANQANMEYDTEEVVYWACNEVLGLKWVKA